MRSGTMNNQTKWSKSWGGVVRCFESKPTLLPGGFTFKLKELPLSGNVLPAGTPVYCDESAEKRTITPLYLFEVKAVDNENSKVSVAKGFEGTRAKVGMELIILGSDLSAAASDSAKVTEIDSSASDVDVLKLDTMPSGISVGKVLSEATAEKKVKVVPNALTPYDTCVDEDSFACDGEGAFAVYSTPVLERRIPILPDVIKKALRENDCFFRFSNRK